MTSREKFEQAIKARFGDLIDYRVCKNSDGEYMAWDMQVAWWAWQAAETDMAVQLANAESKCRELAAESDKTSERMQQLIQIINNADNDYCMCGDAMKNHTHGGCGHPTGMFDYHYNQWLQAENKTPATDAFLAEVRAQGVEMFARSLRGEAEITKACTFKPVQQFEEFAARADECAAKLRQEAAQ